MFFTFGVGWVILTVVMDALLIHACFPLVVNNATERLEALVTERMDELREDMMNKTATFLFESEYGLLDY